MQKKNKRIFFTNFEWIFIKSLDMLKKIKKTDKLHKLNAIIEQKKVE